MISNSFKLDEQLRQDCLHIIDLNLCRVLLMNESQFPWIILVPQCEGLSEICQLNKQQQLDLLNESNRVSNALLNEHPDCKLNIANLGNIVTQLHIHHIARFKHDATWPAPVWGNYKPKPYSSIMANEQTTKWRSLLA